jgi:hypothetical protein
VLEFLHRVVDAFEEFLGAPLLAHKIESNYDVAAQLLTEMCDAGTISTTEPNALRDLVEVEGFMDKLLGNLNLPTYAAAYLPPLLANLLTQINTGNPISAVPPHRHHIHPPYSTCRTTRPRCPGGGPTCGTRPTSCTPTWWRHCR